MMRRRKRDGEEEGREGKEKEVKGVRRKEEDGERLIMTRKRKSKG